MIDLELIFTQEEKQAMSVLTARGFKPFIEAKLEDVRELDGRRHRTFRNQGRYDLILALKKAEMPDMNPEHEPEPVKTPEEMSAAELRAEAKTIPGIKSVSGKNKGDLLKMVKGHREKKELLFRKF